MNYLLGSGYFHPNPLDDPFPAMWTNCLKRYANPVPEKVIVLRVGSAWPYGEITTIPTAPLNIVSLPGNLGHVGQLLSGEKLHKFCGWSASFLTLAMMAYTAELDFIYLEQDCLAIGPWVRRMYADMGDADMVFGAKMETAPYMAAAQSLVLVRHSFIPLMVAEYLHQGYDNASSLPETKFGRLEEKWPTHIRRLSFGVDRERPIPYDDPVFYVQKLSEEELTELKNRKLI